MSIPMMPTRRSGSFAQRRGGGATRGPVGHRRRDRGVDTPAPAFVRAGGWLASLGPSRTTGQGHRIGSQRRWRSPLAATRLVRYAGTPSRGCSEGSCRDTGQAIRSPRRAGEFHMPWVGLGHRWRHRAPLGGSTEGRGSPERFVDEFPHSTGRPTRKWSRRARPSCAILSPRRAAHLQRWTDGEKKKS